LALADAPGEHLAEVGDLRVLRLDDPVASALTLGLVLF
jgi:hypothetical protein